MNRQWCKWKFEGSFQVKCPHRSCKELSKGSFPMISLTVHSVPILMTVPFGSKSGMYMFELLKTKIKIVAIFFTELFVTQFNRILHQKLGILGIQFYLEWDCNQVDGPIGSFDNSNAQLATWCQMTSQKQRLFKRKHLTEMKQSWTKFSHYFIVARIEFGDCGDDIRALSLVHAFIGN